MLLNATVRPSGSFHGQLVARFAGEELLGEASSKERLQHCTGTPTELRSPPGTDVVCSGPHCTTQWARHLPKVQVPPRTREDAAPQAAHAIRPRAVSDGLRRPWPAVLYVLTGATCGTSTHFRVCRSKNNKRC